jgi:hypothetical protein
LAPVGSRLCAVHGVGMYSYCAFFPSTGSTTTPPPLPPPPLLCFAGTELTEERATRRGRHAQEVINDGIDALSLRQELPAYDAVCRVASTLASRLPEHRGTATDAMRVLEEHRRAEYAAQERADREQQANFEQQLARLRDEVDQVR